MSNLNDFVNLMNKSKSPSSKDAPCETCSDFKDWLNQNMQSKTKNINSNTTTENSQQDSQRMTEREANILLEQAYIRECPLQRDQFGRFAWGYLHTMAAYYPKQPTEAQKTDMKTFIRTFTEFFPCEECREDFQKETIKSPPRVENAWELSNWFCEQHNLVNAKLMKPQFDCSKVFERWKIGESKNSRCGGS